MFLLNLKEKLKKVSGKPGIYIMKDAEDHILYVGKAGNLKKRLATYFNLMGHTAGARKDMKTWVLVNKIADFETIITATEKEALILESNLIKSHRPRYNVILKDDKHYPSLCLNMKSPYPNLSIVRKIRKDDNLYFGPFTSSGAVHKTIKLINKTFKLRKCKTKNFASRSRPCINYQMELCLGPCCFYVDKAEYHNIVKEVILFLRGKTSHLIKNIKEEMISAAKGQEYEKAAILRDRMFALEKTLEKQVVISNDFIDRDVIGLARDDDNSLITLLFVRGGVLLGKRSFNFSKTMSTDKEIIGTFIRQYYEKTPFIPAELLVHVFPEDSSLLEDLLSEKRGKKIKILMPKRGEKVRLVKMAFKNAEDGLKDYKTSVEKNREILARLQKRLRMKQMPWRIECFDNSGLSGTASVSGMVVFEKGKPDKSSYRKYKIKTVAIQDDYACMAEVLTRRYGKEEKSKPYPDLLIVDGGKGQLNVAVSILKDMNLSGRFDVIGIAKKDESRKETRDKIYRPGQSNPVNLGREGDLLLFLQRIRDEAHRFAISFHRKRRAMTFIKSELDAIPGIGKKRKAILLKHFKSIKKIREANPEELSAIAGFNSKLAENVIVHLQKK